MPGEDQPADGGWQELPLDSDTDVNDRPRRTPRPAGLRPTDVGSVFIGGAAGVAARQLLMIAKTLSEPLIMMMINVAGCLLLGVLLEMLALRGPDDGGQRMIRLLVGTGMLGGFTSYSTFTLGVFDLVRSGQLAGAVGYGLGSVLVGVLAAAAGVWLGNRIQRLSRGRS